MSNPNESTSTSKKRIKVSQTEFPSVDLKSSLRIANALWDNYAGKAAAPYDIALALDLSPTSGGWRALCGSSIAYGLSEGGYAASEITLSDLGRRIVAPVEDGADAKAMIEAILKPRILNEFFTKYDKAKFPRDEIATNVLVSMGLPKERAEKSFEILKRNGLYVGIIRETKTGHFVALGSPQIHSPSPAKELLSEKLENSEQESDLVGGNTILEQEPALESVGAQHTEKTSNSVFITHGKNQKILDQVKELVLYGKFDPVVAKEHETSAKPVPKKVMDDMRKCAAAVIHVGSEGILFDKDGNEFPQINANVLIEIGAAMALFGDKFILLVEEGVNLPSNLQGLYECRYEGDELNMPATMKLLKAFNEF